MQNNSYTRRLVFFQNADLDDGKMGVWAVLYGRKTTATQEGLCLFAEHRSGQWQNLHMGKPVKVRKATAKQNSIVFFRNTDLDDATMGI